MINIKNNLGQDSVTEVNIREVCKDILEQAKSMYILPGKTKDDSGKGNTVELPNGYSEVNMNPASVSLNFFSYQQIPKKCLFVC